MHALLFNYGRFNLIVQEFFNVKEEKKLRLLFVFIKIKFTI